MLVVHFSLRWWIHTVPYQRTERFLEEVPENSDNRINIR